MKKLLFLSLWIIVLLGIPPLKAQSLTENAFFKKLEGNWVGEGELSDPNGPESKLNNHIEAAFEEDGEVFSIKGYLYLDQNEIPYQWVLRRHVIEGQYLGRFITGTATNFNFDAEYEVTIDEANLIATLNQTSGSSGSNRMVFTQSFEGENYVVNIQIFDSQNNEVVRGKVRFQREEP